VRLPQLSVLAPCCDDTATWATALWPNAFSRNSVIDFLNSLWYSI
jgi:hypothetical protein